MHDVNDQVYIEETRLLILMSMHHVGKCRAQSATDLAYGSLSSHYFCSFPRSVLPTQPQTSMLTPLYCWHKLLSRALARHLFAIPRKHAAK